MWWMFCRRRRRQYGAYALCKLACVIVTVTASGGRFAEGGGGSMEPPLPCYCASGSRLAEGGGGNTEFLLACDAATGGRFAEGGGGSTEPPLPCCSASGRRFAEGGGGNIEPPLALVDGRLEDGCSDNEETSMTGIAKVTSGTPMNSGWDESVANSCVTSMPAEMR